MKFQRTIACAVTLLFVGCGPDLMYPTVALTQKLAQAETSERTANTSTIMDTVQNSTQTLSDQHKMLTDSPEVQTRMSQREEDFVAVLDSFRRDLEGAIQAVVDQRQKDVEESGSLLNGLGLTDGILGALASIFGIGWFNKSKKTDAEKLSRAERLAANAASAVNVLRDNGLLMATPPSTPPVPPTVDNV